ncbi:MAG: hypothetical protein M0Z31_00740 [Clostridia bacterium]|nr:hypothetical protein [Clostridia bacterium]
MNLNYELTEPLVIISYDDAPLTDYTIAFPLHVQFGIPAEINVISDYIGVSGYLTKEQILNIYGAGWNIVAHSKGHKLLIDSFINTTVNIGDKKIYISEPDFFKHCPCKIYEGNKSEEIITGSSGKDSIGTFVQLETGIKGYYSANARIGLTDESIKEQIISCKNFFLKIGISVDHFTYPWNAYDARSQQIVAEHYISARAGSTTAINERGSINRHCLNSVDFIDLIMEGKLEKVLNETVRKRALCILFAHTWDPRFTANKLLTLFNELQKRGIRIGTRNDAMVFFEKS